MHNYKALKAAGKVSVRKQKIVDRAKIDEVKYEDGDDIPSGFKVGDVRIHAAAEDSREELQTVSKSYDPNTGEVRSDIVTSYELPLLASDIARCKADIVKLQDIQAELEQLETDLKAL